MNDLKRSLVQVVVFTLTTAYFIVSVGVHAKDGEAWWAVFSAISSCVSFNLLTSECRSIANKYGGQQ